jgi:4-hydroxybenzoate polyprenyltransferase
MANLQTQNRFSSQSPQTLIESIIKAARPIHWVKNLAIFAALVFSHTLYEKSLFKEVFWAFISFNFATSATYIFNDIVDAKLDRLHPTKKNRPIASGKLSIPMAFLTIAILTLISLLIARSLSLLFFFMVIVYFVSQGLYSLFLKNLAIIDILLIAAGFIIRVYAGAFIIDAHLSVWFLLCVISVALFLASGKRRSELGVLASTEGETRKSLSKYSKPLLDSFVTMFGNAAWLSWALFTFFESPQATLPVWLFLAEISRTTTINKLLMATIPVVIFGIMRYESLIFEDRSEAPEKVLLTDKSLITSAVIWLIMVVWILYGGITL